MGISVSSGSDQSHIEVAADRTVDAIDRLNKSTTCLNWIMIFLAFVLIVLTGVLVWLTKNLL